MIKTLGFFAATICLVFGLGRPASAATLPAGAIAFAPLSAGLTVDGVQFTVSDVTWNGVASNGSTTCQGGVCLWMVPDGPGPNVIIEAAAGIGDTLVPIESATCGTDFCSGSSYDLTADLTATVVGGAKTLTGASDAVTGAAQSSPMDLTIFDGGDEVLFSGSTGCAGGLMVNVASPSASCTFAASSAVTMDKDFGMSYWGDGAPGGITTLATITESFAKVPEPASIASLLFGLVALGATRAKHRRA